MIHFYLIWWIAYIFISNKMFQPFKRYKMIFHFPFFRFVRGTLSRNDIFCEKLYVARNIGVFPLLWKLRVFSWSETSDIHWCKNSFLKGLSSKLKNNIFAAKRNLPWQKSQYIKNIQTKLIINGSKFIEHADWFSDLEPFQKSLQRYVHFPFHFGWRSVEKEKFRKLTQLNLHCVNKQKPNWNYFT